MSKRQLKLEELLGKRLKTDADENVEEKLTEIPSIILHFQRIPTIVLSIRLTSDI